MKNSSFLVVFALLSVSSWLDLLTVLTFAGYELALSPSGMAAVTLAMHVPIAVLGKLFAGAARKYSTQRVLIGSSVLRLCLTATLAFVGTLPLLVMVLALRAICMGFMQPAIAAASKSISHGESSRFASSLNLVNTISKIAAPAIGGVLAVGYGERSVFLISAVLIGIAMIVLSFHPVRAGSDDAGETSLPTTDIALFSPISLAFCSAIFILATTASLFTNMLPFALNYYDIPKITLSISLTASASAGILFNLFIMYLRPATKGLPIRHIALSWLGMGVAFCAISYSLGLGTLSLFLIPLTFSCASVARVYFEVFTTSFIFSQDKSASIFYASQKQSLSAYAAVTGTLIGAVGLSSVEPMIFLLYISFGTITLGLIWFIMTNVGCRT